MRSRLVSWFVRSWPSPRTFPLTFLALLALLPLGTACEDFSDDNFERMLFGTDEELGQGIGVVGSITSDGETVYLSTGSLVGAGGGIHALSPSGEVRWSTAWGSNSTLMVGGDGLIYANSSSGISALDRNGRRRAFDGPSLGSMSWHPWGLVTTWGEGFAILDAFGNTLHRSFEDVQVHNVAAAPDGSIYAIVTVTSEVGFEETRQDDYLWNLNARMEEVQWWIRMDNAQPIREHPAPPALAVHDDFVVFSIGGITNAFTHEMEFIWGVSRVSGPLLIDADGTTYIGGVRRSAISREGEILWDEGGASHLVLTRDGLGMSGIHEIPFGGNRAAVGRVDRRTGEFTAEATFGLASSMFAPVVAGGRLFAAAHFIAIDRGEVSVSQSAHTYTLVGPPAGAGSGWNQYQGPGNRALLRTRATMPDEEHLRGLWVATRDGYARAIHFTDYALNFGLADARVYGIWDGPLHERPRIVQVGTWELRDDSVVLSPREDLAGSRGRGTLRLRPTETGLLDIDDPLQQVRRTFVRAGRLPDMSSLGGSPEIGWIDSSGAGRAEFTGHRAAYPAGDDGLWVFSNYAATGHIGPWQYRPTFFQQDRFGNVTSTIGHTLIGKRRADGSWERRYHLEVDRGPGNFLVRIEGDGLVLSGAPAAGIEPSDREELLRMRLVPLGDDEMELRDREPWPEHERDGAYLRHADAQVIHEAASGELVFQGIRTATRGAQVAVQDYSSSIFRFSASGGLLWEYTFEERADEVWVISAAVSEADQSVYLAGTTKVPFSMGEDLEFGLATGLERIFVARLDLDTGRPLALRGLGGGFPRIAALPRNGFAMLATTGNLPPFNAGVGGPARPGELGTNAVVASFDRDLMPRWASAVATVDTPMNRQTHQAGQSLGRVALRGVRAHSDGSITVHGGSEGRITVAGEEVGVRNRRIPVLHFEPCGNLLPPRRFSSRITVDDVRELPDGALVATGFYESDVIEPPWVLPWPGRLPTPNDPYGNFNGLLMTLERSPDEVIPDVEACPAPTPGRSTLQVVYPGFGQGRVVSTPAGIDCPGQCEAEFDDLTTITLRASAAAGHRFAHFSHAGASTSICNGVDACEIVLMTDTVVEARFDNADVAWVQPIPLSLHRVEEVMQRAGDQIVVRGTASEIIETRQGPFDPAVAGGAALAFLSERGVERVLPFTPRGGYGGWDVDERGWVFASYERSRVQALLPDETLDAPDYFVAFDAQGDLRWAQPLHRVSPSTGIEIGVQHDRVAVSWLPGATTLRIDDEEIDATYAALAIFAIEDGRLLGLNVEAIDSIGTIEPHGRNGFLASPSRGAIGGQLTLLDGDATLVGSINPESALAARVLRQDGEPGLGGLLVDDALVVRWNIEAGFRVSFDGHGAWLGGTVLPSPFLPGWNPALVNATVLRLDGRGVPTHLWSTPAEDEVEILRLMALDDRFALAVIRAQRLTDGQGQVLHEGEAAWLAIGIQLAED